MLPTELQIQYAQFVSARAKPMGSHVLDLLHGAVGVSGEAGELLDAVKKSWVYSKTVDYKNLAEEMGDLMFYMQMLCNTTGYTFESLIRANMAKLSIRYPEKYSDEAAQQRADKKLNAPLSATNPK